MAQSPRQRLKMEEKARRQGQQSPLSAAAGVSSAFLTLTKLQELQAASKEQERLVQIEIDQVEQRVAKVHQRKHELVMKLKEV